MLRPKTQDQASFPIKIFRILWISVFLSESLAYLVLRIEDAYRLKRRKTLT